MDLVVPSKMLRKMRDRQIEKTGEKIGVTQTEKLKHQ